MKCAEVCRSVVSLPVVSPIHALASLGQPLYDVPGRMVVSEDWTLGMTDVLNLFFEIGAISLCRRSVSCCQSRHGCDVPSGRSVLSKPVGGMSTAPDMQVKVPTERHLNLVRDPLYAHQGERDHRHDGYHAPAEILHQREREHEEVERDALLQVDAV